LADSRTGELAAGAQVLSRIVTVSVPDTPPEEAEMVEDPADIPVMTPAAVTAATEVDELAHVAVAVRSFLVPSE
jgi:hypothetical protein